MRALSHHPPPHQLLPISKHKLLCHKNTTPPDDEDQEKVHEMELKKVKDTLNSQMNHHLELLIQTVKVDIAQNHEEPNDVVESHGHDEVYS